MGVPEVRLVDPSLRTVTLYTGGSYTGGSIREQNAGLLPVPHTPVQLEISQIFSALDDYDTPPSADPC